MIWAILTISAGSKKICWLQTFVFFEPEILSKLRTCPKNLSLQFVVLGPWILVIQSKLLNRSKLRIVWSDLGPSSPSSDQNENWLSKIQFFGSKLAKESFKKKFFRLNKFDFFPFMVGDFPEETFKNKMTRIASSKVYISLSMQ